MKLMIWVGLTIGGIAGSWLGSLLDNGNYFGIWGILLGTLGGFIGLWIGYKVGQNYL